MSVSYTITPVWVTIKTQTCPSIPYLLWPFSVHVSLFSLLSLCFALCRPDWNSPSSMDTMAAWGGARCATQGRPQKTLLPFFELAMLWVTIHKLTGKRGTKWPRGVFMLIIWIWRISSSVKKSKLLGWKVPKMTFEGKCIIQRALSCWKTNLTMDLI